MTEIAIRCDFLQDLLGKIYGSYFVNTSCLIVRNDRVELMRYSEPTEASFRFANAFKAVFPHLSGQVIYMCLESPELLAHAELLAQISTQLRETQVKVAEFIVNNV